MTTADIPRFFKEFFSGRVIPHFWFMYMLIGVYLSAPFLQMIRRQATRSQLWVVAILCLVVAPPYLILYDFLGLALDPAPSLFLIFTGYFILGHLLYTAKPVTMRVALWLFALCIVMILVGLAGQWHLRHFVNPPKYIFLSYTSINVVIMSAAFFCLVRALPLQRLAPWGRAIAVVSNATYGIYLVHILVRFLLKQGLLGFKLTALTFTPVLGVLVTATAIFLLSLVGVLILKQIPYLRQTVGYGKSFSLRS
jgi:surface polysaccharide O-acyltransferase-like enzyme